MGTYIVLMGVQGAGKGTQAAILQEKLGLPHVSTGDLFRAMKTQDTPLAQKVRQILASGDLVSDDITNEMVARSSCSTGCWSWCNFRWLSTE